MGKVLTDEQIDMMLAHNAQYTNPKFRQNA